MKAALRGKTVLVTGSEGFVGRRLVAKLSEENNVIRVDLKTGFDLSSPECLDKLEPAEIIFHLAALVHVPTSFECPDRFIRVNIANTAHILEHARRHNSAVVYASSYLYGIPEYLPIDERHRIQVSNPYMASKFLAEQTCLMFHQVYGLSISSLRFFNIYGPGQSQDFLIPKIVDQVFRDAILLKDAKPKRDFVYIDDVVDAYLAAARNSAGFQIFNIGSGVSYSVAEVVETILRVSDRKIESRYENVERQNEIPETLADIRLARERLDWSPSTSLEDGLRKLLTEEGKIPGRKT